MAAMNIPFFRIPVPEVLEREIDQNITACNAEVKHLNQLRAAYQQAIDGKWPEGLMRERFHRYRVAVIASREKAARLR
jgi:hypothetical protein